jgi:hypothetical protein
MVSLEDFKHAVNDTLSYELKIEIVNTEYLRIISKLSDGDFNELCKNNNVELRKITNPINQHDKRRILTELIYEKFKNNFKEIRSLYAREKKDLCYYNYGKIRNHITIEPHYEEECVYAIISSNMKNLTKFIGDD